MRTTSSHVAVFVSAVLAVVIVPNFAQADAGVPMLAVAWPLSWYAFIPIVLLEAYVARRTLRMSWRTSSLSSLAANASSTLVGIPLTWAVLTLIEIVLTHGGRAYGLNSTSKRVFAVTVQAPWLIPYESDLYWMVPTALLVLLPFFWLSSVFIERSAFAKISKCTILEAKQWSWRSNILTYSMAMAAVLGWLIVSV